MDVQLLEEIEWKTRANAVRDRLIGYVDAFRDRRARGHRDVVSDFLFEYYGVRGRTLTGWSPGLDCILVGEGARTFVARRYFESVPGIGRYGVRVNPGALNGRRRSAIAWIRTVLENTQNRPPFFGCAGMHEWAMIGTDRPPRHVTVPLRYSPAEIDDILRSNAVACTHFDAFRFFAPENRPRNVHQLDHESIPHLEQPGCLHANMDVLRWSLKLYPFVPSELVADAFELAHEIRTVDMRASPYDLRSDGLEPIPVETATGKATYREYQNAFFERAHPLRAALIDHVIALEDALEPPVRGDNKEAVGAFTIRN